MKKKALHQFTVLLEDWIPKDASIAIAVGQKYVYYRVGTHDIHLKEGQTVQASSLACRIIQKRQKLDSLMDNTLYGTPYFGIGYPIEIEGQPAALVVILPPNYHVLKNGPFRYLTGKKDEDWSPIPIEKVMYMESLQKKTWFYADDEQYSTTYTLKNLHLRLPDSFIRIHRSYIVNISFIQRISRDITSSFILILKDSTELPVSQTYMNEVRKILGF
ncbi:LytTR family DNA-binding domain-containing protein [Filibacter tadaridae]|uniref:Transcriptional regulatory protein YpdB n=1 Tax=Filibacter tadaridae TaxID=2483811 RepID=A0A3P5WMI5_9BACL|nr:LytTR family DNA-binding domain-containing protein [Filibacter tadaridae]VDC24733.1 Transcriptional regulatory protein YpdB [Filibacter tadaridae]